MPKIQVGTFFEISNLHVEHDGCTPMDDEAQPLNAQPTGA